MTMMLVHLHCADCRRVQLAGLKHTVYTNGDWHVSDIHFDVAPKTRARFTISKDSLNNTFKWPGIIDEISQIENALSGNDAILHQPEYYFAIASSFLLRFSSDIRCRTVCWTGERRYAMIGWGNDRKYGIKIRHDDHVFNWNKETMRMEIVAPKDVGSRKIDPVRDMLAWQFHQATAYELNPDDILNLSTADLSESKWKIAG